MSARAIERMDEADREVLGLRYLDQLAFDEIAAVLEIGLERGQDAAPPGARAAPPAAGGDGGGTLDLAVTDETGDDADATMSGLPTRSPTWPTGSRGRSPTSDHRGLIPDGTTLQRLLPAIRLLSELADEEPTASRAGSATAGRPGRFPARARDRPGRDRRRLRGPAGLAGPARGGQGACPGVAARPPATATVRDRGPGRRGAPAPQHRPRLRLRRRGGVPYLAMRLIEGRNLAEVVGDLRDGNGRGLRRARSPSSAGRRPRPSTTPIATTSSTATSSRRTSWSSGSSSLDRRFRAGPRPGRQRPDGHRRRRSGPCAT